MYQDLTQFLLDAEQDSNIHVIMITGDENDFCAGNDLNDFITNTNTTTQTQSV
jgi:enoyl-CoA hydratase/carnithine racemase